MRLEPSVAQARALSAKFGIMFSNTSTLLFRERTPRVPAQRDTHRAGQCLDFACIGCSYRQARPAVRAAGDDGHQRARPELDEESPHE